MASDNIELFYTRYQPNLGGHMLRSDDVEEFVVGVHPNFWSTEQRAYADRAERLFRAWCCVLTDDHMDWVAFAAIVDRKRIVVGVEAVRELLEVQR